jgi:hypothetical protein
MMADTLLITHDKNECFTIVEIFCLEMCRNKVACSARGPHMLQILTAVISITLYNYLILSKNCIEEET